MTYQSLSSIDTTTQSKYSLTNSQITAVEHCLDYDHTLMVAPKGFGKTRTGLAIAAESEGRTLIICPNKVRDGWGVEGRKIGVDVYLAEGEEGKRRVVLENDDCQIVVLGVDLLPWFVDKYRRGHHFSGLIIDETTRFGKAGNAGSRKLRSVHKTFDWVLGLTAQPVMEDPLLLYGQALAVDGGRTLGRSLDRYKQRYFYQADFHGYDWKMRPGADTEIAEAVSQMLYVPDDGGYEDTLPPLTDEVIPVTTTRAFAVAYADLCESAVLEVDSGEIEAVNEAVLSGKLEQLCQGAVYDQMQTPHWVHYAKFDHLEGMLDDEPTIVVYLFEFERDELRARWPHGRDLKDPGALEAFNRGDIDLLFMHPRSGSHGINAQERCCEMICLKPFWSADGWDQVIGRIRRRGQMRPRRRRTLVVPGTIDEIILDRVAGKEEVGVSLMTHIKEKARK